jgi:3'-phosphoadenosine 5'-phosphosulfate sulfotransferase (PAPS reductase)/FAD synthetase
MFREFWPLQDWTYMDVWAYIISNNLSYPSVYDKYAELDGWDKVRFHSFFDPSMDKFGRSNVDGVLLWKFKNRKKF